MWLIVINNNELKTILLSISKRRINRIKYYYQLIIIVIIFLSIFPAVPPNIVDSLSSESTVAVKEHQNITLICKAEGYPEPTLMWRREDGNAIPIDRRSRGN